MDDFGSLSWKEKFEALNTWRNDLTKEALMLPQTLSDMREIINDLRRVSKRLEQATAGIEFVLKQAENMGISPMARQIEATANDLQTQIRDLQKQVPGGEMMGQAMDDLQRTFTAFTNMLPLPKPPRGKR